MHSVPKALLHYGGVLALLRRWRQGQAVVVRYHSVYGPGEALEVYAAPSTGVPADVFARQLAFLARAYRVVPLADLVEAVRARRPLPRRAAAITFDDGYADNFRHAFPVLQRLGVQATVFVTTGARPTSPEGTLPLPWMCRVRALVMRSAAPSVRLNGSGEVSLGSAATRERVTRHLTRALVPLAHPNREEAIATLAAALGMDRDDVPNDVMLSWTQVRQMASAGVEIGAHTLYHGNLPLAPPEEAREEIRGSKAVIEAMLGAPVRHFAYPNTGGQYPHVSAAVMRLVEAAGFRGAVTSRPGAVLSGCDPLALPRLGVTPRVATTSSLAAALERHRLAGRRAS
jgi:peptidoglycan/xylan/chitin deacetylase (PgdA/CDA1 family)